jgi:hypothetical protein
LLPILLGAGLLLSVGGDGPLTRFGMPEAFGMHIDAAKHWLAPGFSEPWSTRLVLSYAFLQSSHYAIWLLLIPQDATRRRGPASFLTTLHRALRDFSALGLALILGGALIVAVGAVLDPLATQALYLFVTPFHGYLELAALGYFAGRSRGPQGATACNR